MTHKQFMAFQHVLIADALGGNKFPLELLPRAQNHVLVDCAEPYCIALREHLEKKDKKDPLKQVAG